MAVSNSPTERASKGQEDVIDRCSIQLNDPKNPSLVTGNADDGRPSSSGTPRLIHLAHLYLAIGILFVNYFLAQYDKFILSYFRASVVQSLGLTESQYGLLSGYSTGIVYAVLALPVAFIADYTAARVWTLSIAAAWWSLCVVFQGLARNFAEVYCARLGMGIGQAAVEALSISLISDLVEWRNVFVGQSVFFVGVYVGEAISGQIATSFVKTGTSWQVAMRAIGITGIIVAALLRLILREPNRRASLVQHLGGQDYDDEMLAGIEHAPIKNERSLRAVINALRATVTYILRMRSFWLLVLSAAMRQLAGNVFGYYMPGYLASLYPDTPNLLSRYGIIVGTVGSSAVLGGGFLTSLLWHKTKLTPIYLTSIGGMISSIFVLLMIFSRAIADNSESRSVTILYGTMSVAYLTAETWLGCLFALIALLLPPAYKTFGLAIWSSVQVLIYSSGPEIIGLALQNVDPTSVEHERVTQICLAVLICVGYWACGIGLLLSIPLLRRDFRGEFIHGPLSKTRKVSVWAFGAFVVIVVVVLFVLSLTYGS